MQLYLRLPYKIHRQQNSFEWTTEHQKRFEEKKLFLLNKYQIRLQTQTNHFMQIAMLQTLASAQPYQTLIMDQIK